MRSSKGKGTHRTAPWPLTVRQHFVRLSDFLEPLLSILLVVRVFIWVPFQRGLPVPAQMGSNGHTAALGQWAS